MSSGESPTPASAWPTGAWAMAGLTALALTVGVLGRVVSPSLALDLVALWPVAALAVPAFAVGMLSRRRRVRAVAPLLLVTWLMGGLGLHLAGWTALPSAVAHVVGPDLSDVASVKLSVALPEGDLVVGAGDRLAVEPLALGGRLGVPVIELSGDDPLVVGVLLEDRSSWYRFGGFDVRIPSGPSWAMGLRATTIDADLRQLDVAQLTLFARSGRLRLPAGEGTVVVSGGIRVEVPSGIPVSVEGEASTPEGWVSIDGVTRSPVEGKGWSITIQPGGEGSVEISTH